MGKIKEKYDLISKTIYITFLYFAGIVLPLYINDGYFDIMEAKAKCFNTVMPFIFILSIFLILLRIGIKKIDIKKEIISVLLILFSICLFITYIVNDKNIYSLTGSNGWNVGILSIISLMTIIIAFKDIKINNYFYIPVIICSDIIFIIAILHSFEIDAFNLHYNILEVSYHKYLSTIGNINWYVGYLALLVPVYSGLFLTINDKKYEILFFISSILGIINISMLGADGIFLGFGLLSFFCIPFILKNKNRIKKFSILLLTFSLGLFIARELDYCMDGYSGVLRSFRYILPIFCLAIVLLITSFIIKKDNEKKICTFIIVIAELLVFIIAIIFIILAIRENNNEWGTGRIALWIDSLKIFINFPLLKKLFGIGIECLYLVYRPINIKYAGIYTSSHSEWIQLLITGGYINTIIYFICWVLIIFLCTKNVRKKAKYNVPIIFGLICYLGQTVVNSATLCNISILSILIVFFLQNNNTI